MQQGIIYGLNENFIENLSNFLIENFKKNKDYNRIACIFGGKRPALFLYNFLAKKLKSFIPPRVFSMDEFIDYLLEKHTEYSQINDLEAAFLVYKIISKNFPQLLNFRESFGEFLPLAREIISFIEQLDLEEVKNESLYYIQKSAEIGYDVPQNINNLIKDIANLREIYHKELLKNNIYSRGMKYLFVSSSIDKIQIDEFDYLIFCNLFYLHNTEIKIIKNILDRKKGIYIIQGDPKRWKTLYSVTEKLNINFVDLSHKEEKQNFNLYLYQSFDMHSTVSILREILLKIEDKNNTVVVIPRPQIVIPLLMEISSIVEEFNVSIGYPLKYTSFYSLFLNIFRAQKTKEQSKYYTKDYLSILSHPAIKNLNIKNGFLVTKVLIERIQYFLQENDSSSISGKIFIELKEIEKEEEIYKETKSILDTMGINITTQDIREILLLIHNIFFKLWEKIDNFEDFSKSFIKLLDFLLDKSLILNNSFNLKILERLYEIPKDFLSLSFKREKFDKIEIWEIFKQRLESEMISFSGSPLKGMQILGLFETRSINFENVIVLDVNESILPSLKLYNFFIPQEIMLNLGLNPLEKENQIQNYYFKRLISSSKSVYLIYEENEQKERSRFIEEILWEKQKKANSLNVAEPQRFMFYIKLFPKQNSIEKTENIIEFLKKERYSASKINTYINCPISFYYRYVLGLTTRESLLEDPQSKHIGVFIHQLLEETFSVFKNKKPIIDNDFKNFFFKKAKEKFSKDLEKRMGADFFLLRDIIIFRLKQFLQKEAKRDIKKIISLEEEKVDFFRFNSYNIEFTYTIDRIDELEDETILVIDYKTGGGDLAPKRFRNLKDLEFNRRSIKENIKSFQLPIYYYFVSKEFKGSNVNAMIYNLRSLQEDYFLSKDDYENKDKILKIYLDSLSFIFDEIFDLNVPFEADPDERKCFNCEFNLSCGE